MATLHVENTVHDFETWKAVFDKFDRFRAEHKVLSYRLGRDAEEPNRVSVDLDFDSLEDAESFRVQLEKIWQTPQSKAEIAGHVQARLVDVVESVVVGVPV